MTQKTHTLFYLFAMVAILIITGCTNTVTPKTITSNNVTSQIENQTNSTVTPTGPCNAPYFISVQENFNKSIPDKEAAYQLLINIEPGWSNTSQYYADYKNSKSNDVEYKDIIVSGKGDNKQSVYVLKDQIAIDSNGQVYRKGGCI